MNDGGGAKLEKDLRKRFMHAGEIVNAFLGTENENCFCEVIVVVS